ncbi:AAA family ATPase [Bradyrhizobium sp. HKCCYLS3077]|uniref:AAA family ATPase n=1 Tax=Bradyrhizobium sp. HKCCYLS3077 TaxID=3420761 RepID=UPI003EB94195
MSTMKEKQAAQLAQRAKADVVAKLKSKVKSAADLQHKTFAPLRWIVPGVLTEGLSMLVGKPKVGKSWMALDIAIAVSTGGACMGRPCEQGDVLALFLEDNERRIQRRMTEMIGANKQDWPPRLSYVTTSDDWPRLGQGGTELIEGWIKQAEKPRLIIVDILERVRDRNTKSNASAYSTDYEALVALHKLASEHQLSILVLHHQRKAGADDLMDTINGTGGIGGALDTLMVLGTDAAGHFLYGRGRDLDEFNNAVEMSKDSKRWIDLGWRPEASTPERKKIVGALLKANRPMSVAEIAKAVPSMKPANVKNRLADMCKDGEVESVARGVYRLPDLQGKLDVADSGEVIL